MWWTNNRLRWKSRANHWWRNCAWLPRFRQDQRVRARYIIRAHHGVCTRISLMYVPMRRDFACFPQASRVHHYIANRLQRKIQLSRERFHYLMKRMHSLWNRFNLWSLGELGLYSQCYNFCFLLVNISVKINFCANMYEYINSFISFNLV